MRAAIAVAVVAGLVAPAVADGGPLDPTATLQPVELVFAADETGAGSKEILRGMTDAAATRALAATACFDKKKLGEANALALVIVSKAGKTTKVMVGGSGDASVDKCLEKAVKATVWPATSRGGTLALSIVNATRKAAADDDDIQFREVKDGTPAVSLGGNKTADAGGSGRVSGGSVTIGAVSGSTTTFVEKALAQLQAKMGAFKTCYDKALRKDATVSGAFGLRLTIGGDGKVVAASSLQSLGAEFDTCMTKAAKSIQFPSPPDGNAVDLAVPFNLSP